jgi:beta-mannosidase
MNRIFYSFLILIALVSCGVKDDARKAVIIELNENWQFRQAGKDNWMPAKVPGTVHTDLLANKIIEDPYYRVNEKQLQWIDKADWEYRNIFIAGDDVLACEKIELEFKGLDTYAKVYLNGELLLEADNMFRTWVIDVKEKVKHGENELTILFESPTRKGLDALKKFGFQLAADNDQSENGEMGSDRVSPYVRKAPYHFGWDWGPRLVTSGIWRGIELRAWGEGRIENVQIITENLSKNQAGLITKIELDVQKTGKYSVNISLDSILNYSGTWNLEFGIKSLEIPIFIENPELWWPNGLGDQKLYTITVEILKNNEVIDRQETTIGLRTARLVQDPDPDGQGRSFYFEVNGRPVFAKGANYIPNDIFLNRVSPEKYEFIIKSAAEANMNMLRVWGGGIYEEDLFYDLCDQYGIMVWQDFMFACAMYPGDDAFLENVRHEAIDNVKRLRNHPSVLLWCGNNEIEAAWGPYDEKRGWGWKQRYTAGQRDTIWKAYDTLFHHILPAVVQQEDPVRPYWHSSPSAGMGQLASYETTSGDMHYWGVWHGLNPLSDFRKYKARFMSEYGFQSFPEFNSVKKYALPEDYNIESEVMAAHQRSGIGNLRIRQYMEADYKIPADFEQFLYVGQLLQAEAIKMAIESHRAEMPYCMGSLYWQINDCWPVASWSGIDYYGRWKALHYFVKEAFKPTIIICDEDADSIFLDVVSDSDEIGNLKLEIRLIDFKGNILWQGVNELGNDKRKVTISRLEILKNTDPASVVLVSELIQDDKSIDTDLLYFVKPKDLQLIDPLVKTEIKDQGENIEVVLTCNSLAKNVFLYADGLEGQFSDNYFDLLPGKSMTVLIPKSGNSPEVLESLNVLHLFTRIGFSSETGSSLLVRDFF